MRMKDEPEVEEEEEEEEEEKEKEEHEKKKLESGSSRLQQEIEPEAAVQGTSPPTDNTCSGETKNRGTIFLLLLVLFSGALALIVDWFEKAKPVLACAFRLFDIL